VTVVKAGVDCCEPWFAVLVKDWLDRSRGRGFTCPSRPSEAGGRLATLTWPTRVATSGTSVGLLVRFVLGLSADAGWTVLVKNARDGRASSMSAIAIVELQVFFIGIFRRTNTIGANIEIVSQDNILGP
jgi:hypothetical protein